MTTRDVETPQPLYRDPTRSVSERVEDLLARMTLREKLAQLGSRWIFELADRDGLVPAQLVELLKDGLGQVTRISGASSLRPADAAQTANAIQAHLVEHTRLGIPAIVHEEICSGLMARDAVVFPQAIGLASTWDAELVEAIADAIRVQMRASGAHQGLGPVLDVARDPRWGRTEETFGEDPHLVAAMGTAFVAGLQGAALDDGVVATGKHFVGYAASEGGRNWGPPVVAPRLLRDVYLHPFEAAIRDAGLRSVMHAYNELDGIPCAADRELLTTLLREELGFEGAVVSDYFAVRQLAEYHHFVADAPSAAAAALSAGIDAELPSTDCYGEPLEQALEQELVSPAVVDEAVRRVLALKFELGLFERPFVDTDGAAASVATDAQRTLARRAAAKSIVLLRNDDALPLRADATIAVIGPSADEARHFFGDYAYPAHIESLRELLESGNEAAFSFPLLDTFALEETATDAPSLLEALRARCGERVSFARGCGIADADRSGFDEAVALARASDVAVLVVGDKSGLTDDCTTGESRDRSSLDLPGVQEELVRAVAETGTPVVLVLVAGRPMGSEDVHARAAAVVLAWLPGEHGAGAIADVLVGDANPGGKLPISFPRNVGQLPTFYGHKISGGRSHWKGDYVDGPTSPLYPFGFGLSYTTFALEDVQLAPGGDGDTAFAASATVRNTGARAGDEVVQLYVRDPEASVTRPVLELKAFVRVGLEPGEARRVRFEIPLGQLGFSGRDLGYVVEAGELAVYLGTSSSELHECGSVELAPGDPAPAKAFHGRVTVS